MARDGHQFAAYLASPAKPARGAVVVLQEIFGVNAHIRSVAEQYAAAGFLAIAPALFDRIGRNIELGYGPKDMEQGTGYRLQIERGQGLLDIGAVDQCRAARGPRRAGRLLLGRTDDVGRRRRRCRCMRRSVTTRAASGRNWIACRRARFCCTMASAMRTSRASASNRCTPRIPRHTSTCIRLTTGSIATRAQL